MVHLVETAQIYLNEQRQGLVTCMHCGLKRPIDMANYTDDCLRGKALQVQCSSCGKAFQVKFNSRRYHRINVNLPGKILHFSTRKELSNVIVTSLSVNGICFIISDRDILKCNNLYDLIFYLDDDNHSIICEEIVIKRINSLFVGAEFCHSDRYNHELDFYVTSELHNSGLS
jgi:hypothetical protein